MKKLLLLIALLLFPLIWVPKDTLAGCFAPNDMGICDSGATCPPGPGYGFCCDTIAECGSVVNRGNERFSCTWNGTSCVVGVANCSLPGYTSDPLFCAGFSDATSCNGQVGSCAAPAALSQQLFCDSSGNPTSDPRSGKLYTAIGCIPISNTDKLIGFILRWAIGIGGGIAFILIIIAGFQIMTSSGNPERIKAGQELLTSAITGIILLIFSVFILEIVGVRILGIPGFGQ